MDRHAPRADSTHGTGLADLPDQGQLVYVRQRPFVVTEVSSSVLQPSPLARGVIRGGPNGAQHLVTLSSVEEDTLGEQLQVIWEIEPGAHVSQHDVPLPELTGFDPPARLDAFLDAVRWGAASSADLRSIQAPFRSGIKIEDYQLDPVVRAIQMPRANLLIADDVGLGKTIESGLVIPRAAHSPPRPARPGSLPVVAPDPVARPDAGQVRSRVPHRR